MRRLLALVLFALAAFLAIPLLLLGLALLAALGLAAAGGLIWALIAVLTGHWLMGLESFGVGAGAFVGIVLAWDRVFAVRDAIRRRYLGASDAIPASSLRIDFRR